MLYGMTRGDASSRWYGDAFSVRIDGSDSDDLHTFIGGGDGGLPYGDLTLSGGTLFGMTSEGGNFPVSSIENGDGTVFAIALPDARTAGTFTPPRPRSCSYRIAGGGCGRDDLAGLG